MSTQAIGNFVVYRGGEFATISDDLVPPVIFDAVQAAVDEDEIEPYTAAHLAKAGGVNTESYGCGDEMIEVYQIGALWYVEHFTTMGCDVRIVITSLPDFMTFQAKWLAPMSQKIMTKGFWCDWAKANSEALEDADKDQVH